MPSGSPVVPSAAASPPPARSSCGGGWPALHQRSRAAVGDREEGGHEQALGQPRAQDRVGLREHLGGAVAVERARLDEEAHHRGGRRDLQPAAADVADQQPEAAAGQRPDPEHVAAAGLAAGRLVDDADLVVVERGRALGDEARGHRARHPALAVVGVRVGERRRGDRRQRDQPRDAAGGEAVGVRGRRQHAEQPRAERQRHPHLVAGQRRLGAAAHPPGGVRGGRTAPRARRSARAPARSPRPRPRPGRAWR